MSAELPETIGAYRIVGRIGRGAMGVVYRAIDTRNEREVALKVMLSDFASDESARSRFLREAEAVSRLQHRNIVTVYECGVVDEAPFIAMELLKGASLAARLASTARVRIDASLNIVKQLCDGLQFAHDHGIVHRDVKPANVWLLDNGAVKLLDFGVAKMSGSTLTVGGGVVGSAAYMSPEQFGGGEVDGRSDIFSAGAVLYELLTRRRAFDGPSVTAVMHRILHEAPVSLASLAPDVPQDVAHAVETALQKDPNRRYANAADFGDELRLAQVALANDTDITVLVRHDRPAAEGATEPVAPRPAAPPSPAREAVAPPVVAPPAPAVVEAPAPAVVEPPARPVVKPAAPRPVPAPASAPVATAPPVPSPPAPSKGEKPARSVVEPARVRPAWLSWIESNGRLVGVAAGIVLVLGVAVALTRRPAPASEPPAASFEIQVQSTPPGAAIAFDGRPTGKVTPATVAWQQRPARVGLVLQGFETVDAVVPASPERPVLSYSLRRLLRIVSEPAGAQVFLDGRSAGVTTPAEIPVPDPPPSNIELRTASLRRTIALTRQALDAGELRVVLPAPLSKPPVAPDPQVVRTPVSVRVIGNFPFEVAGCDTGSPTATEHDLEVMAPCTLRLRAPSYFLDTTRAIEASSGRVEIVAPQLARVQLRSSHEQCTVIFNGRAVGGPPVDLDLAAGTYTATIQCPDKTYRTRAFTIDPGRSIRRLDDDLLP